MNSEENWRTPNFRANIISKIEEAMQQSAMPTSKSSSEMESHVFTKAKNKEEYLGYVARLILHVRDINNPGPKKMNMPPGMQPGMQPTSADPMNALRAMTQPGTPGQMMNMTQQNGPQQINPASNLLQSLNQRPNLQNKMAAMQTGVMGQMGGPMGAMQQNAMQGTVRGQMGGPMGAMQPNPMQGPVMNQMGGPMGAMQPNPMQGPVMSQMGGPMGAIQSNTMQGAVRGPIAGPMATMQSANMQGPVMGQMGGPMGTMQSTTMQGPVMGQMGGPMGTIQPATMQASMQQSPMQQSIPQGAMQQSMQQNQMPQGMQPGMQPSMQQGMQQGMQQNAMQQNLQQGMQQSLVGAVMRPAGPVMAPSPGSNVSLNTPGGQLQPTPSPLSVNDDQAFQEKVRQLSRYIEPLRRVIQRSGSGDSEKTSKMKKLLEILSSSGHSGHRITMDTLLKCETVLEKLDFKSGMKEQHPLIEAITTTLQNPNANHTFQRTFGPIMSTLNGRPLKNMPRPLKRKYVEESVSDIPDVLQGEVARLVQRFKVSLDPVQQNSAKCVHLQFWLDDRHLPCIPPIQIMIPEDYPNSSPKCHMSNYEYGATEFLQLIQEALQSRISKLPPKYTMSQLLDTWEDSVRETCSSVHSANSVDLSLPLPAF